MKHLSFALLLHSVILLPFAVTAGVLIYFRQYSAAAVFSFLPAMIVVGIWWIAAKQGFSAEFAAASRRESDHHEMTLDE